MEQIAEPGGVCIQDAAYQTVPKRLPFEYENLGERELQGFTEPIRAYAVNKNHETSSSSEVTVPNPVELTEFDLPDKPSIAVLPFDNMSSDPEQEYFSDGITEDIIIGLSHMTGIFVIARN